MQRSDSKDEAMNVPESPNRKFRLVDKPRFYACTAIVILVCASVVYAVTGAGGMIVFAEDRANAPEDPAQAPGSQNDDWKLVLVNEAHPLPEGFGVETRALPNGLRFDARAYGDLARMLQAGKDQGLSFVVCSAYRSYEKQKELFDGQVAAEEAAGLSHGEAVEAAKTKVALPGTSEHNLGLAADIVALDYQKLDAGFLDTPECRWLRENAYKYGFIMRYPEEKSAITKIVFEPWHYRYVGVKAATEITQKGLCLEEYLGMAD
jgi:D-alanyl-D-alanine carboxypeptidase